MLEQELSLLSEKILKARYGVVASMVNMMLPPRDWYSRRLMILAGSVAGEENAV
jgi:hypothetical protein